MIPISKPWSVSTLERADAETLIAAISHDKNFLQVWTVASDRTVESVGTEETGFHPDNVRWVDWDGDGKALELLVAVEGDRKVQLWQHGFWGIKHLSTFPVDHPPRNLAAGDIDGDGQMDLIVGPYEGDRITLLWGLGNFAFEQEFLLTLQTPAYPRLVDWDRDGDLDIVWSDWGSGSVQFGENLGGRKFSKTFLQEPENTAPRQVDIGDIDRDGNPDAIVSMEVGKAARIFYNDGAGRVRDIEEIFAPLIGYSSTAIGEYEGKTMLALSESESLIIALREQDQWQLRSLSGTGLMLDLQFSDVDKDGHPDLVYVDSSGEGVQIVYGPIWEGAVEVIQ